MIKNATNYSSNDLIVPVPSPITQVGDESLHRASQLLLFFLYGGPLHPCMGH